jgi:excisionase family DNA binding protein
MARAKKGNGEAKLEEELMTVSAVARRLNVHRTTIQNWLDSGLLEGYRFGSTLRVSRKVVEKFLEEGKTP